MKNFKIVILTIMGLLILMGAVDVIIVGSYLDFQYLDITTLLLALSIGLWYLILIKK
ncbi:hypothetical protein HAV_01041 [Candidatus Hepatincola sp. Av]